MNVFKIFSTKKNNQEVLIKENSQIHYQASVNFPEQARTIDENIDRELLEQDQLLKTLLHTTHDLVVIKDGDGRWLKANHFTLSLFELEGIDYYGKTSSDLATIQKKYKEALQACENSDHRAWEIGKAIRLEEMTLTPDGRSVILEINKTPLFHSDGSRKGIVSFGRDITQSYHDPITRLPNRSWFEKELDKSLHTAKNNKQKLAIMYLFMNRFKYIRDTLGHKIGDRLLKEISERLHNSLQNHGFVARTGDDEFAILLPNIKDIESATKLAHHIESAIEEPFFLDAYELYITARIGISLYPNDGSDQHTLMNNAQIALNLAKEKGKNHYQIYNPAMNVEVYKVFSLERDLRKALKKQELEIYYQPRIDINTDEIVSAEALLRWNHPEWGLVAPNEFIPIAEETGLIISISEWVKESVCRQNKEWQLEGLRPISLSVNISPKRFIQQDFIPYVQRLLKETQLDPKYFEIEITEDSLLIDEEVAITTIHQLRELGVKIALDDFGSGYSSLSYLKKFKVDTIKIDKSFIIDLEADSTNSIIVKGIINLAKNLNLTVVAEGVENRDQLQFVHSQKCDQAQGFLYSKPVPADEFKKILKKGKMFIPSEDGETAKGFENQRKYFRVNFQYPLASDMTIIKLKGRDIELGNTEVLIEDIGLGGLRFLSNIRLAVQPDIILEFETEILDQLIKLHGYVVWGKEADEGIFQYGLEFTMDENERESFTTLLNKLTLQLRKNPVLPNCRFISGNKFTYFKQQK